ncbi:hypothetical protein TSUD_395540 [Trifolium subterraneum]|uniref:Leucine-rich repeat-containing N-terminal plant-type domain-containing protein n=1 Tax=Trifolium subterraneum TaxID=3900 RepID=A0A2Z6NLW0_TRISU|nr:hypothetical protein TSUD_395540 [Trifolium subterraneum]
MIQNDVYGNLVFAVFSICNSCDCVDVGIFATAYNHGKVGPIMYVLWFQQHKKPSCRDLSYGLDLYIKPWCYNCGDPCEESWIGVPCSGSSVILLKIKGMSLTGSLGAAVYNLQSLKILQKHGLLQLFEPKYTSFMIKHEKTKTSPYLFTKPSVSTLHLPPHRLPYVNQLHESLSFFLFHHIFGAVVLDGDNYNCHSATFVSAYELAFGTTSALTSDDFSLAAVPVAYTGAGSSSASGELPLVGFVLGNMTSTASTASFGTRFSFANKASSLAILAATTAAFGSLVTIILPLR